MNKNEIKIFYFPSLYLYGNLTSLIKMLLLVKKMTYFNRKKINVKYWLWLFDMGVNTSSFSDEAVEQRGVIKFAEHFRFPTHSLSEKYKCR